MHCLLFSIESFYLLIYSFAFATHSNGYAEDMVALIINIFVLVMNLLPKSGFMRSRHLRRA